MNKYCILNNYCGYRFQDGSMVCCQFEGYCDYQCPRASGKQPYKIEYPDSYISVMGVANNMDMNEDMRSSCHGKGAIEPKIKEIDIDELANEIETASSYSCHCEPDTICYRCNECVRIAKHILYKYKVIKK